MRRSLFLACALCAFSLLASQPSQAESGLEKANAGLPVIEDFSESTLRDDAFTNTRWVDSEAELRQQFLKSRRTRWNTFMGEFNAGTDALSSTAGVLADFNGDGYPDLAVANNGATNRLVPGDGSAEPFDAVGTGLNIGTESENSESVVAGDVDNDGDIDVVFGNQAGAPIRLYLNNGSSDPFNFVASIVVGDTSTTTDEMALADFDGDGDLDLYAGKLQSDNRIFYNDGSANPFAAAGNGIAHGDFVNTTGLAAGDVDGDGLIDIVTAGNLDTFGAGNTVYFNDGAGDPFDNAVRFDFSSFSDDTLDIALGDLNNDGLLDIVCGQLDQANTYFLNEGGLTPFGGPQIDISNDVFDTHGIALVDIDSDGDLDVAVSDFSGSPNIVYNNGAATPFSAASLVEPLNFSSDNGYNVLAGDLNYDGLPDIVTINNFGQANTSFINNGNEDSPYNPSVAGDNVGATVDQCAAIAVADINGDGRPDIVQAGNFSGGTPAPSAVYYNNGSETPFSGVTPEFFGNNQVTRSVAVGDLNNDGNPDVVLGNFGEQNRYFISSGAPTNPYSPGVGLTLGTSSRDTTSIALADINHDGFLDVVEGVANNASNRVYLNDGIGSPFDTATSGDVIGTSTDNTSAIAAVDVNGDGWADVISGNVAQLNRVHFNNSGTFSGAGTAVGSDTDATSAIVVADMSRDGRPDLLAASSALNQRYKFYLNNGTATAFDGVIAQQFGLAADQATSLAVADIDGDGDLDVLAGCFGSDRVFLGDGDDAPLDTTSSLIVAGAGASQTEEVVLADFDNDGGIDWAAGHSNGRSTTFRNLTTTRSFGFADTGVLVGAGTQTTLATLLYDLDADGDLDLVEVNTGSSGPLLYRNTGAPGAADFSGTPTPIGDDTSNVTCAAAGDVNADGLPDLVLGRSNKTNLLFLNDGAGDPFDTAGTGLNIGTDADDTRAIAIARINSDVFPDVLTGNAGGSGELNRLYLNQGTADPFAGVTNGEGIGTDTERTLAIAVADANGDGLIDFVAGNDGAVDRFYANEGDANRFTVITNGVALSGSALNTRAIVLADTDLDGDLDVITGNLGQVNQIILNDGSETPFSSTPPITPVGTSTDDTTGLAVGDFDGNGRPDVLTTNGVASHKIHFNASDSGFAASDDGRAVASTVATATCVAVGDVDLDGDLDFVAGSDDVGSALFLNRRFSNALGQVRSIATNTGESISAARLTAADTTASGLPINYYLSNDGGAQWFQVDSGRSFIFPSPGNDLRWRAELGSFSPLLSPSASTVKVEGDNPPSAVCQDIDLELDEFGNATLTAAEVDGGTTDDLSTPTLDIDITSFTCANLGPNTVTLVATDDIGQEANCTATVTVKDVTPPVITLNGASLVLLECGDTYFEPGAAANDSCGGDLTGFVSIGGDAVNINVPGDYVLTYDVADASGNSAVQQIRTVTVSDTTPPSIALIGASVATVECGGSYSDEGATATDSCGGDLTGFIVTDRSEVDTAAPGTYSVYFDVQDPSGNSAVQVVRTVIVSDTSAPVINLIDSSSITFECGEVFVDPGFTATDACSGDLTSSVTIGGDTVDTSVAGASYTITYDVTDAASNNAAQVTRTVNIVDNAAPVITLSGANPLFVDCGAAFTDPGAVAVDACEGDVAVASDAGDAVDPDKRGAYVITYTAQDSRGQQALLTRDVVVRDCNEGAPEGEGEGTTDNLRIEVYVSELVGSDGTGDGTPGLPWRTIGFALSQVEGLGTSVRPAAVVVLPGVYDETIVVPRHTRIIGLGVEDSIIAPTANTLLGESFVVDLGEGCLLQDIAIYLPEDAPPSRTGIRVNEASVLIDRVLVDGGGALSSIGLQLFGEGESSTLIVDSEFVNLFGAVRAIDSCAMFFRCLFESILGDAITILQNARKGDACSLVLGDADFPGDTGSNSFVDIGGLFVRNLDYATVLADNNDFGTPDPQEVGDNVFGPVGFGGVLSKAFALSTLFITVRSENLVPISNATVTALAQGTATADESSTAGVYAANITAGFYSITVKATGFQSQTQVRQIAQGTDQMTFTMVPQYNPQAGAHAMDADHNGSITLSETLRVVQLYNAPSISCGPSSEDGYQIGPVGGFNCLRHSADYNAKAWKITLSEMLRIVQIFNVGAFNFCPGSGTEDGYCLGG